MTLKKGTHLKSILFVCLGNICRSPLAEAIAKKIASKNGVSLHIDSAGTSDWHEGESPCENSIKVAKNHDIDITNQKSRLVKLDDNISFDYVVAMDENNYQNLKQLGFTNLYKMGDFGGFNGSCVPDPYHYKEFEGFEKVYAMLELCIDDFLKTKGLLK